MKLREQAYQAFTQHLLDRRLQPGQFVTQRELADLTGHPLGAIREMIPHLEADGLLRAIPQRGLQIVSPDVRLVREAYQLREVIECAAVVQYVRSAPDAEVARQMQVLDRIAVAARKGVTPELLSKAQEIDWGFHYALVESMNNRLIAEIHRVNSIRIRLMMPDRIMMAPDSLPPAITEHGAILRAVKARDETAAQAALRTHLASSRARALGFSMETETGTAA
jgi:DNA-binding GntR family transcriptional regulator